MSKTVIDHIVTSTMGYPVEYHLCDTDLQVSPGDDRVIWLVTSQLDDIVVGAFAAEPQGQADDAVLTAHAHHVIGAASSDVLARVEAQHASLRSP